MPLPSFSTLSQTWVFHSQEREEGVVRVKVVPVLEPEVGTSPVPVQPVATYWVVPKVAGDPPMEALTRVPKTFEVTPEGMGEP